MKVFIQQISIKQREILSLKNDECAHFVGKSLVGLIRFKSITKGITNKETRKKISFKYLSLSPPLIPHWF